MTYDSVELSLDDFESVDWEAIVQAAPSDCRLSKLGRQLREEEKRAREGDEPTTALVLNELASVCSLHLRPDQDQPGPFVPLMETDTHRSPVVNDLTGATIQACIDLSSSPARADLRARMADVAWVAERDFPSAKIAIRNYLQVVTDTVGDGEHDNWSSISSELERAFQIAQRLGNEEAISKVCGTAEALLDETEAVADSFFAHRIIELLRGYSRPEDRSKDLLELADNGGKVASDENEHRLARRFWTTAMALAASDIPDNKSAEQAKRPYALRIAESFEEEAQEAIDQDLGNMYAADALMRGVEVLRRVGATDRAEDLHSKLVDVQTGIPDELNVFSHSIDLGDLAQRSQEAVKGKSLEDALMILMSEPPVPDVSSLRTQAQKHSEKYVLKSLFSRRIISREGKVVEQHPSVGIGSQVDREAALRGEMLFNATFTHQATAQAVINPIRRIIVKEHPLQEHHLRAIVQHHPMVPTGREQLIARGLIAGFYANLPTALHLLIPQFENSLRYVLAAQGKLVSSLNDEGLQKEHGINKLLYEHEGVLQGMFGEDVVFALQGLLVEKTSGDFRNKTMHGLADTASLASAEALYLWWLFLRVFSTPVMNEWLEAREDGGNAETDSAS